MDLREKIELMEHRYELADIQGRINDRDKLKKELDRLWDIWMEGRNMPYNKQMDEIHY